MAEAAGMPQRSAERTLAEHREWLNDAQRRVQAKVLAGFDGVVDARVTDASNADSRTGPASARWLTEDILGWSGRGGNTITVHGDVNQTTALQVNVDAAAPFDRAAYLEARRKLGLDTDD